MKQEIFEEIRDSLNQIKSLATPVVIVSPTSSPDEIDQLRAQLEHHRLIDIKGIEPVYCGNELIGHFDNREVFDIVHSINVLAMANTDVIHVFAEFSGHINTFKVTANRADTDYQSSRPISQLFNEYVRLNKKEALEQLLSIESKLTELIIEAREEAEAKAEVTA